jgi:hypothetical protein
MRLNQEWKIRTSHIVFGVVIVVALVVVRGIRAGNEPIHLTTDWSHHHLIFSAPHNLAQQIYLYYDPRYLQQLVRRRDARLGLGDIGDGFRWRRALETPETLNKDWSEDMGATATVGAGNYPAKYSFNSTSANCGTASQPDFVVYNTSAAGSSTQPNIVAFDNLYSGCATGTVPSTYWAFNTGTGTVVTSPTLSGDGKQVAFVQSTAGAAELVILKWAAGSGTLGSPTALTTQTSAANYRACTAPCMYTITFSGTGATHTDTLSSPFYSFATDTIYVGDSVGYLHQFTAVFKGNPAETTTTWPVLAASAPLSSPVFDEGTGYVFVDAAFSTTNNGGRLHKVCATTTCGTVGTTVASGILGPEKTSGIATCQSTGPTLGTGVNLNLDAPVLDPVNQVVYVPIGNDGLNNSAVYQFAESYVANNCGTEIKVGTGSTTGVTLYNGNFDNLYYCNGASVCTTGGAGHFYVCGNTGGDPTLYQITVSSAGVASGTANTSAALTTAAAGCGPVIEEYNSNAGPAADYIFTSVTASAQTATPISCPASSGCIMSFNVVAGSALSTSTKTLGHTTVAGGASGVVVDNTVESSPAGASQVYFTPLASQTCTTSGGTGGCAIQASQSGLN